MKLLKYVYNNNLVCVGWSESTIDDKELVAVIGPSGSGKTTLLNIIGCNVEMPLLCKNKAKRIRRKAALENLKKLEIEELKNKYPNEISGGQRQRCAIARALTSDNGIILADEPTGALDQNTGREVIELLKDINAAGTTVIIVTHDMNVAKQADRIIQIVDGKIVEQEIF